MPRPKVKDVFQLNPAAHWPCLAICCRPKKKPPTYCTHEVTWDTCMVKGCSYLNLEIESDAYIVKKEIDA
jgi:hypothetical protein